MLSSAPPPHDRTFSLLVPVKALHQAKSRLRVAGTGRERLMRAFALDVVTAALAGTRVERVHVVTAEPDLPLPGGVERLDDQGGGDLNAALRHAERTVRLRDPGRGVAALCADLPALTPADLDEALGSSTAARWYVADAQGVGTTLLVAAPGVELDPHFGQDSAHHHEQSGAAPLAADVQSLRHDVDTEDDLRAAAALGLGRHTRTALGPAPRG